MLPKKYFNKSLIILDRRMHREYLELKQIGKQILNENINRFWYYYFFRLR